MLHILTSAGPRHAALQRLNLRLKLLDHGMALLQILVKSITLSNQLLLPLPEPLLLNLDLLREPLAQLLFLLLELGIIQLPRPRLAKLPRLHLLCTVGFVVVLFGRVDEIKHVRADENGAQFLEVAVVFVLDFCNTPGVLSAFDGAAVGSGDVALAADDGKGHCCYQAPCVLQTGFVVLFEWWSVDFDALGFDHRADLAKLVVVSRGGKMLNLHAA